MSSLDVIMVGRSFPSSLVLALLCLHPFNILVVHDLTFCLLDWPWKVLELQSESFLLLITKLLHDRLHFSRSSSPMFLHKAFLTKLLITMFLASESSCQSFVTDLFSDCCHVDNICRLRGFFTLDVHA